MDEPQKGSSSKEIIETEDIIRAVSRVLGELDEAQRELIADATKANFLRFQRARSRWFALIGEVDRIAGFSEAMTWACPGLLEARNG